ncbi:MAG: hypothetical protein R3D88_06760 [Alphaproteobacteria bacterium]
MAKGWFRRGLSALFDGFGVAIPTQISAIYVPIEELHTALFHIKSVGLSDNTKASDIIDFLKTVREQVLSYLPENPTLNFVECEQELTLMASGLFIAPNPKPQSLTHIDNAQLTLGQLQACVENRKGSYIKIDHRILENYTQNSMTIMSATANDDNLYRRTIRLSHFIQVQNSNRLNSDQKLRM